MSQRIGTKVPNGKGIYATSCQRRGILSSLLLAGDSKIELVGNLGGPGTDSVPVAKVAGEGTLGTHPPAHWTWRVVEFKAAAEGDRSRKSNVNDDTLNGLWSLDLLVTCSFAARTAVIQPGPLAVEPVRVSLQVFGRRFDPAPGVDRAADDYSVETLRAHVVGTGGDSDLHAEGFKLTPNDLGDLLCSAHLPRKGHQHPRLGHCASSSGWGDPLSLDAPPMSWCESRRSWAVRTNG
jgi:hypothetical protein